MKYRRLDENGDMTFGMGDLDYLTDSPEAVAQSVLTRLRLWTGEWFLDTSDGTPYQTEILGKYTQTTLEPALRKRILDTDGVTSIDSFTLVRDEDARAASVVAEITTIYGTTEIRSDQLV